MSTAIALTPPILPVLPRPPRPTAPLALLVNDTASLRQLKRLYLERAGYATSEVLDGQAALDFLRESAAPVVVIMTSRMPGPDAADILRATENEPQLRRHGFVLTTALANQLPEALFELTKRLRVPVLGKPFTEQDLLGAVTDVAGRLHLAQAASRP